MHEMHDTATVNPLAIIGSCIFAFSKNACYHSGVIAIGEVLQKWEWGAWLLQKWEYFLLQK
jgi:hypothetical protein